MTLCLNPDCPNPENPERNKFCQYCGAKLLLDRSLDPTQTHSYRALQRLGAGGFSKTYLAVDESKSSKPRCIIKQFRQPKEGTQNIADLFREEVARLTEIGNHPQIPAVLASFNSGSQQYVVQEFINGQNLGQQLRKNGNFSETEIRQLLEELLPVLYFIHHHRLIHRDIKPENIIFRPPNHPSITKKSTLFLVDFGAAKYATKTALAQVGTLIGSAEYTAPEQLRGKPTFASDIYSLGVTCIHLLTHVSPFDLFDSLEGKWIWQDYLLNPVSDSLARILNKMLASAIKKRYYSAEAVLKQLNPQIKLNTPVRQNKEEKKQEETAGETMSQSSVPSGRKNPPATEPSWKCVRTLRQENRAAQVNAIAFSAQSRTLASGSWDGSILIWDLGTGELLQTLTGHNNGVLSLAIAPDGKVLASGSADGTIKLWDLWQLSPRELREGIAPVTTHTLTGHTSVVSSVAICPDKQLLASGSRDRTVTLWTVNPPELRSTFSSESDRVTCVAFNPKWATRYPLRSHFLASGTAGGTIYFWQTDTGELQSEIAAHSREIYAIAISPDGTTLISASWDRTLKIWNLSTDDESDNFTPQLRDTLCPHVLPVVAVAIHPDGEIFATGSHDTTVQLWNLKTTQPIAMLSGHSRAVTSVAFSPDGNTLASASGDGTVKLWRCEW